MKDWRDKHGETNKAGTRIIIRTIKKGKGKHTPKGNT